MRRAQVSRLHTVLSMTTLDHIRAAIDAKQVERTTLSRRVTALNADIASLKTNLEAQRPLDLVVTDHALLRYAERVLDFDTPQIVAMIRDKVAPTVYLLGDGEFPLCPGFVAVVKNRTVVTIMPK